MFVLDVVQIRAIRGDKKMQKACRWCEKVLNPYPTQNINILSVAEHENSCPENPKNKKRYFY